MQRHRCQTRRFTPSVLWGLVSWLALAICGCRPSTSGDATHGRYPLKVVCTTAQVGDMIENLGGRHVQVQTLMGPGVDPHLYKATPGDRRALNGADSIFFSGLHLEGRLAGLLEKLADSRPVYAVTDGLTGRHPDLLLKTPGTEGTYDPHVWFDVSLWAKCVDYSAEKLIDLDPQHRDDYRRNAEAYRAKLDQLHQRCQDAFAEIPKPQRVLVTAHDAFGYWGRAYGVEVHGLQGISTVDEADLGAVNDLVDLLVGRKIKSVFVESSVPPRNVRALVESCAARGHKVTVGGELFSDAMGPAGTPEGTYVGMVEYNLKTIVEALK